MPEAVLAWIKTHNFNQCSHIQEDIILTYEDDFSKYKKRVSPDLLRTTLHGICHQPGEKITFKQISADYRSSQIREAVRLLTAENGGYPPTQNGDIRSLFWLFSLMALQN